MDSLTPQLLNSLTPIGYGLWTVDYGLFPIPHCLWTMDYLLTQNFQEKITTFNDETIFVSDNFCLTISSLLALTSSKPSGMGP